MSAALTRGGFIAAAAAAVLASTTRGRAADPVPADDVALLNLALAMEHLQAALYSEAERAGALGALQAESARVLGGVERAHVAALTEALGADALTPPLFDVGAAVLDDQRFARTAVAVEDLAAATHQHVLPLIASPEHRALLASIHTVDAGHAAWVRLSTGVMPVAAALDEPVDPAEAIGLLRRAGIASPRPGAAADDPWSAAPGEGPALLTAFPLGHRPPAAVSSASGPPIAEEPHDEGRPWLPWIATTGTLSALVVTGIGLRARAMARRVTIVGPDEGPRVSQQARPPGGVVDDDRAAQTAGMHRHGPVREKV